MTICQDMEPAVRDLGRVVEDAVERNSWGKSRSDRKCRFPNAGGLHRTSGNAPLDTQNISLNNGTILGSHIGPTKTHTCKINDHGSTITPIVGGTTPTSNPSWCHVNISNTPSSKRTQVAACAFKEKSLNSDLRLQNTKDTPTPNKSVINRLNFSKM